MQKIQIYILYTLVIFILILFFILGRISTIWDEDNNSSIEGVNFATNEKFESFINTLENYSKDSMCTNEIEIFEETQREESKKGAEFVASKRGKYYYAVDSKKGIGLSEDSRIYFQTEKEAQANGYVSSDK